MHWWYVDVSKNGIPISNVKDFLGLSDISTTSRYAYADNEDIQKSSWDSSRKIISLSVNEKKDGKEKIY